MPTIQELVAKAVAEISPRVEQEIVDAFVDRKVKENADTLVKCIDRLTAEKNALKKLERPDNVTYDKEGKEVSATYTKARWDEIKKKREFIVKIEKAIEKGLGGDVGDAKNFASGKGPAADSAGDSEATDTDTAG